MVVWFLLLLWAGAGPADAGWSYGESGSIVYALFIPSDYAGSSQSFPLLMHLHGVGERGSDFENIEMQDFQELASTGSQQDYPCFVYAPQCPEYDKWVDVPYWSHVNFDIDNMPPTAAWSDACAGLESIVDEYRIDTSRVYLSGGSMGGYGAWYTLAKIPERFAAAVPIAGGGDPGAIGAASSVPVWAFHGTDDNIVPVAGSRTMVSALQEAGGLVRLTEYSYDELDQNGYDHYGDHIYCLPFPIEPGLKEWIFSKRRGNPPTAVPPGGTPPALFGKSTPRSFLSIERTGGLKVEVHNGPAGGSARYTLQGTLLRR